MSERPRATPVGARDLVLTLLVAASATPALWFGARGEPEPLAMLVWVTLIALPGGCACGARRIPLWPLAPVVPVLWLLQVGLADALSTRDLPALAWSALPIGGFFGIGFAIGSRASAFPPRAAATLFLLATLLCALPLHGLALKRTWSPRVAAFVLDLAPTTLVAESAGVDWMRHPPIYDGSQTVDIDPSMRTPYGGHLAGSLVFVVGCLTAAWSTRARRRPLPLSAG